MSTARVAPLRGDWDHNGGHRQGHQFLTARRGFRATQIGVKKQLRPVGRIGRYDGEPEVISEEVRWRTWNPRMLGQRLSVPALSQSLRLLAVNHGQWR